MYIKLRRLWTATAPHCASVVKQLNFHLSAGSCVCIYIDSCLHISWLVRTYPHPCTAQINPCTWLGPDSLKASYANRFETILSHSDGLWSVSDSFKAIWMALKLVLMGQQFQDYPHFLVMVTLSHLINAPYYCIAFSFPLCATRYDLDTVLPLCKKHSIYKYVTLHYILYLWVLSLYLSPSLVFSPILLILLVTRSTPTSKCFTPYSKQSLAFHFNFSLLTVQVLIHLDACLDNSFPFHNFCLLWYLHTHHRNCRCHNLTHSWSIYMWTSLCRVTKVLVGSIVLVDTNHCWEETSTFN